MTDAPTVRTSPTTTGGALSVHPDAAIRASRREPDPAEGSPTKLKTRSPTGGNRRGGSQRPIIRPVEGTDD
jgi:hypothetical protein